jgi:hypothetical protein
MACVACSTAEKTTSACTLFFHPAGQPGAIGLCQPAGRRARVSDSEGGKREGVSQGRAGPPERQETRVTGPNTEKRPSKPCSRSAAGMLESRSCTRIRGVGSFDWPGTAPAS